MGKLINWGGHGNLGDDAMVAIIQKELGDVQWDIFGGGTLISPSSEFYSQVDRPENTVALSVGVAASWKGENTALLQKFKRIYTRDYYSHFKLLEYGILNTLSVDLMCYLEPTVKPRKGKFINLLHTQTEFNPYFNQIVDKIKENADGYIPFALSADNDLDALPNARVYTDAQELVNDLCGADVIATRLHANVLAWVAGANIHPISYDPKVCHFFERVAGMTPSHARTIIRSHLNEIRCLK